MGGISSNGLIKLVNMNSPFVSCGVVVCNVIGRKWKQDGRASISAGILTSNNMHVGARREEIYRRALLFSSCVSTVTMGRH